MKGMTASATRHLRKATSARATVNISPVERFGRILVGLAAAIAGILLLTTATAALAVAMEVLLILTGFDLLVTGGLGHCPLYTKLGHIPRSLRSPR